MRKVLFGLTTTVMLLGTIACTNNDDIVKDNQLPIITDQGITAVPMDCDVFQRGGIIPFRYRLTDNDELGSYNIEIHNNFDHHTHGTQAQGCSMDPVKTPIKPFHYDESFKIPSGSKSFDAKQDIKIPADIDPGDYHFVIRVTDQTGNQQLRAMAIKIK